MIRSHRCLVPLALVAVVAFSFTGCGSDSPLNVDAAKDLLPKALESVKGLKDQILSIDSAESAAALKDKLGPIIKSVTEMLAKIRPAKNLLGDAAKGSLNELDDATGAITQKVGGWVSDTQGQGKGIVEALGKDLVDRLLKLKN